MIKTAINGFGRIGRLVFRASLDREEIDVVAINAPDKTPAQLAYILRYDTVHGNFQGEVSYDENHLIVNGKKVLLLDYRDPTKLDWKAVGAEYVMECTGKFLTKERLKFILIRVPN